MLQAGRSSASPGTRSGTGMSRSCNVMRAGTVFRCLSLTVGLATGFLLFSPPAPSRRRTPRMYYDSCGVFRCSIFCSVCAIFTKKSSCCLRAAMPFWAVFLVDFHKIDWNSKTELAILCVPWYSNDDDTTSSRLGTPSLPLKKMGDRYKLCHF